jgi:hypothetical protein
MFPPKDPAESIVVTFDFTTISGVTTVSTPVIDVSVVKGTDAAPSALKSGSASVQGAKVLQRIVGGVDGCVYELHCQADTPDGSRYVISEVLAVETF